MAHLKKYTRNGTANLFAHYDRTLTNNSNKDIDPARTQYNYNLAPEKISPNEILKKRLSEIKVMKRKDVNVVCSWVVTLPKDFHGNEKNFFQATYNFLEKKYGQKNVVSAWVHNDESQPHLHFAFVPVVIDKKKNIEKCSAYECITKYDLMSFHNELENELKKSLGQEVHILNGATKEQGGNLTVQAIKKQQAELDQKQKDFAKEKETFDKKNLAMAYLDTGAEESLKKIELEKIAGLSPIEETEYATPEKLLNCFPPKDTTFTKEKRENWAFRVIKKFHNECKARLDNAKKVIKELKENYKTVCRAFIEKRDKLNQWERLSPDGLQIQAEKIRSKNCQNWKEYEIVIEEEKKQQEELQKQQQKKSRPYVNKSKDHGGISR